MAAKKKVLVTGANGFIGQVLCRALINQGFDVRALTRIADVISGCECVHGDLTSDNSLDLVCADIDTVFHLAGKAHSLSEHKQDEAIYWQVNTEGTHKLLLAAKNAGVKRFIYFSSIKAVDDQPNQLMNESVTLPASTAYGRSKFAAEQLVLSGHFVEHAVVLRPTMVYGETHKGNLPKMITAIQRGLFPPLPECHNRRSMVHVNDVVQAALLAAQCPQACGQIYIITDDQAYSTRQLYDLIRQTLAKPVIKWSISYSLLQALAKMGDGIGSLMKRRFLFDSDHLQKLTDSAHYSSVKISRELGYSPQYTLPASLPSIVAFLNHH